MEAVTGCRNGLVCPDNVKQEIFERDEDVEDLVAKEREEDEAGSHQGVHEVMVGRGNNDRQDERGVSYSNNQVEDLPEGVLAHFALFQGAAEETRVVDHGHANAECVAKMHRGHRCELVDKLATHPYTLCVVMADGVEEAVLLG